MLTWNFYFILTRLQSRPHPGLGSYLGLRIPLEVHIAVGGIHFLAAVELSETLSSRPAGVGTSLSFKGLT